MHLNRHNRPRESFDSLIRQGLKAAALARESGLIALSQLSPDIVLTLEAHLAELPHVAEEVVRSRREAKSATAKVNNLARKVRRNLFRIHRAITHSRQGELVERAFGVNKKLKGGSVDAVNASARQVVVRLKSHPEEGRSAGIELADVEEFNSLRLKLHEANRCREQLQTLISLKTQARDQIAKAIFLAVRTISAAGVYAFRDDAARKMLFEALAFGKTGIRTIKMPPWMDEPAVAWPESRAA